MNASCSPPLSCCDIVLCRLWFVALLTVFQQRSGVARMALMENVDRWVHEDSHVRACVYGSEIEGSHVRACVSAAGQTAVDIEAYEF